MILEALYRYYGRLLKNGEAPEYGFSKERIPYALVLSAAGKPLDVLPMLSEDMRREVPFPPSNRSGGKIVSNFLWDKTQYALGNRRKPGTQDRELCPEHFDDFKAFNTELLRGCNDRGIKAFLKFLDSWNPDSFPQLPHADDLLDAQIVFKLDGQRQCLHECDAARTAWLNHLEAHPDHAGTGMCLITGEKGWIARLHPPIKGVPKTKGVTDSQPSGTRFVSFNQKSFRSFGKEKGANAPVSIRAAFGYTTALNTLLSKTSRQKLQIGAMTVVFWAEAEAEDGAPAAAEAENLFGWMLGSKGKPDDEAEAAKVGDLLRKIAEGRPLKEVASGVVQTTRFYVIGLMPNGSRLSLRFWRATAVGTLFEQVADHWRDLQIHPLPRRWPPSADELLLETVVREKKQPKGPQERQKKKQREKEKISPVLGRALMTSILTGSPYPRALLSSVLGRLKVERSEEDKANNVMVRPLQIAILNAVIRRDRRLKNSVQEDTLMSLERSSDSAAYNLGRLFAVYAYAERSNAKRNATIRDKYVVSASTMPRRIFAMLMRGYEHNRSALLRDPDPKKKGPGFRADYYVKEIFALLPGSDSIPVEFGPEDQIRFFIGLHHQHIALYSKSDSKSDTQPNRNSEK